MKKNAALLMCIILGAACVTGCAQNNEVFTEKRYSADSGEITEICIDVRDRQIDVAPSADNQIHINYFDTDKEYHNISVTDGHTLSMTTENNKDWTDYIGGKLPASSRKILLQLPDSPITALKLSTTNKDISIPSLANIDNLSLASNGGNLIFDNLEVGNTICLDSKNGDIRGTIIGSYDEYAISCNIKKGESNLPPCKEDGAKNLTVSNNNGNIEIKFTGK